jgi:hypothetical protein
MSIDATAPLRRSQRGLCLMGLTLLRFGFSACQFGHPSAVLSLSRYDTDASTEKKKEMLRTSPMYTEKLNSAHRQELNKSRSVLI